MKLNRKPLMVPHVVLQMHLNLHCNSEGLMYILCKVLQRERFASKPIFPVILLRGSKSRLEYPSIYMYAVHAQGNGLPKLG